MKRARDDTDFSVHGSGAGAAVPSPGAAAVTSPSGSAVPAPRTAAADDVESPTASSSSSAAAAADGSIGGPPPAKITRRTDYLNWDDYFIGIAFLSAQRSKDPSTQVGACIVDEENRICGVGYNGMPKGCPDDALPWARSAGSVLDTKYPYVVHAEANAIMNKNQASLKGCRIYVALFPCNECAKLIIQSGLKEVVFLSDKYHDDDKFVASRRLLSMAGVRMRQYTPSRESIVLDFRV